MSCQFFAHEVGLRSADRIEAFAKFMNSFRMHNVTSRMTVAPLTRQGCFGSQTLFTFALRVGLRRHCAHGG